MPGVYLSHRCMLVIVDDDVFPTLSVALGPKDFPVCLQLKVNLNSSFFPILIYAVLKLLMFIRMIWEACLNYLSQGSTAKRF